MSGPYRLNFEYDEVTDILTIEGVEYDGELFRAFANAGPDYGSVFRFKKVGETVLMQLVDGPLSTYVGASYKAIGSVSGRVKLEKSNIKEVDKNEREKSKGS